MDFFCDFIERSGPPLSALSTHWTLIRTAKGAEGVESIARNARNMLAQRYYRPLFHHLVHTGTPIEKARELTGRVMDKVIDGSILKTVEERKGSFRKYLLGAVGKLMADDRRETKIRREVPLEAAGERVVNLNPLETLEHEIAWEVFGEARRATEQRLSSYRLAWKVLRVHDLEPAPGPRLSQEELAAVLKVGVDEFRDALYRAREVFKEEVNRLLAEGVESEDEMKEEIAWFREQIRKGPPPPAM